MTVNTFTNYRFLAVAAAGLALIVSASTCLGVYFGTRLNQPTASAEMTPAMQLKASTAAKGKDLSMATGYISDGLEGLYVLDHVSGNLQCWMLSTETGAIGGIYRTNVRAALEVGKSGNPDYVMTTGAFFWQRGNTGNVYPAKSICYVADGSSGNVVGYHLTYNQTDLKRGVVQTGELRAVCRGIARDVVTRDQ